MTNTMPIKERTKLAGYRIAYEYHNFMFKVFKSFTHLSKAVDCLDKRWKILTTYCFED